MAWDPQANSLFPHTVTLTAPGALNQWGRKAPGAGPVEVKALVEYKMRQVRTVKGDLSASSIAVYLSGQGGVRDITPEWSLQLPGQALAEARPIVSVARYADEQGDLLEVVFLQ